MEETERKASQMPGETRFCGPVAEDRQEAKPRLGFLKGRIEIPDDFDRMGGEKIEKLFGLGALSS